jgi:iron-sulfur cluster repair protein YtfE (RIC family)
MPIIRNEFLKPISREHHHGLLFCWKIRTGLKRQIALVRIKKYSDWFWINYLKQHFDFEEKYIFPILGNENKLIKKALEEHSKIKTLFETTEISIENLTILEKELESHIRFEERILFNEIQDNATHEQLHKIEQNHTLVEFIDSITDQFWE